MKGTIRTYLAREGNPARGRTEIGALSREQLAQGAEWGGGLGPQAGTVQTLRPRRE